MKVLEKGRKQKGWAQEFTCTGNGNGGGGCGAKLLVEQRDIFETASHARDESTYYSTFICPECKRPTDLPSSVHLPFQPRPMTVKEKRIVHRDR